MESKVYWEEFCKKNEVDPNTQYEVWAFGDAPDKLVAHVINGAKTATASLFEIYEKEGEPVPQVGDYSVIIDSMDQPMCVIQTIKTMIVPFDEVGEEQAYKEGEGDRSLSYWRRVHEEFFQGEEREYGVKFHNKSPILCEEFQVCDSVYQVTEMTDEQAREVVGWKYQGEYAEYNMPDWEECVNRGWSIVSEEKRKNAYYSVLKNDEFLGFFHVMDRKDHIELGLGIHPDMCGKKNGHMFLMLALGKIENDYPNLPVNLQVRTFNQRAIHCYEGAGFQIVKEFVMEDGGCPKSMYLMELKCS